MTARCRRRRPKHLARYSRRHIDKSQLEHRGRCVYWVLSHQTVMRGRSSPALDQAADWCEGLKLRSSRNSHAIALMRGRDATSTSAPDVQLTL